MLTTVERELTEEEVKKIETDGIFSIFPNWELVAYGVYHPMVREQGGKKYIWYRTGTSCD